jgi:hypothetical protein
MLVFTSLSHSERVQQIQEQGEKIQLPIMTYSDKVYIPQLSLTRKLPSDLPQKHP